ncbi:hypothetical protein BUALT_Bualt11G0025800 [Buddleja alternifolia]|uniref:Dof zinc finger protein n=1 Tax=Buddleja alternifolia TaxID=168488 RepID=A0AAV6WSS8_9LAMI|nr:hypothetical protein BUALT_Bualt11G0025800 [Buddleja alternifolia]
MSPDNKNNPAAGKDETLTSAGRKTTSGRPQEPPPKCPRCDSPNTKFCYYNNYSLTQPRHFCKTCRRYWTKGGALRNVPIGGGCRKNKKMKSSPGLSGDSKDSCGSSDIGGLKFFQGLSPAMDFQLNFPRLNYNSYNTCSFNQFSSFGDVSNSISSNPTNLSTLEGNSSSPVMGFNFPEMGSLNLHSNLASSIESLSSINQDLHWKLQQQRLATLFVGDNQKGNNTIQSPTIEPIIQKPQPILFQNLDISSKAESCERKDAVYGNLSTEWYFDNCYSTHVNPSTPATSSSNLNENSSNWSTGIQAWTSDFNRSDQDGRKSSEERK